MNAPDTEHFLTDVETIIRRIAAVDPKAYDRTRNHLNGATTWLSPFLTHGVTSTAEVARMVLRQHRPKACYRLMFELAWREFFHRTWQIEGEAIFADMRHSQAGARHDDPPAALLDARTGLEAIDAAVAHLVAEGTMHNHARMWVAMIATNLAHSNWPQPARWLHYHLLDGDLASNTLSWQWVAGTFSDKRYVANQDNVNKYAGFDQHDTWLDVSYEELADFTPPELLHERRTPMFVQDGLPGESIATATLPHSLALRSIWHLDPRWRGDIAEHVVFVDSAFAERWPMSENRWQLIRHWSEACGTRLLHGTVAELRRALDGHDVTRVEYPACNDWPGTVEDRDWLYPLPDEDFPSFSRFWKRVRGSVGL